MSTCAWPRSTWRWPSTCSSHRGPPVLPAAAVPRPTASPPSRTASTWPMRRGPPPATRPRVSREGGWIRPTGVEAWGAAPRVPWREDAIPPRVGANLLLAPHRAVSATRDNSGVYRSGCHRHRGIGVLPGAQGKGCHTPAQQGGLGSPVLVDSRGVGGHGIHSYLIFKKGISYFCTFL